MRRIKRLAIVAATTAVAVLGSAGVASAAIAVTFDHGKIACSLDDGTNAVEIMMNISGDAQEDTFDIVFSGVDGLDPDPSVLGGSGGDHNFSLTGLGDGVLLIVVTHAVTDEEYDRFEIVLSCGGPTVQADAECADGEGYVRVALLTQGGETFDVSISEEEVGSGVSGSPVVKYDYYGPYPAGEYTVEVMRLDVDSEPWIFNVEVLDCSGEGSGLPDAGSDTGPLVLIAGGLVVLGGAMLLTRRTRLA